MRLLFLTILIALIAKNHAISEDQTNLVQVQVVNKSIFIIFDLFMYMGYLIIQII